MMGFHSPIQLGEIFQRIVQRAHGIRTEEPQKRRLFSMLGNNLRNDPVLPLRSTSLRGKTLVGQKHARLSFCEKDQPDFYEE